jgi:hypothetical protein
VNAGGLCPRCAPSGPSGRGQAVSRIPDSISNTRSITCFSGELARPGPGPANRGAAGAVRGAAWRRPGDHPEAASNVEPYVRADGTRIWSLMQLERQLRREVYGRRRGGYLDRRRIRSVDP